MISKNTHWNSVRKRLVCVCCFLLVAAVGEAKTPERLHTPLEKSHYRQLTGTEDRSEYLKKLSEYSSNQISVQHRILGKTVNQLPMDALLIQCKENKNQKKEPKLRVMILAGQHGSEISGCEALLIMAGNWISDPKPSKWMKKMEILMVPAVNPDGIQNRKRVNALGVNISTDFGLLAAPESAAVNKAMLEFKPHVVLDIHESALLKKKSLGAEGWLTDFEAQFEYGNNPNIDKALLQFSADVILPRILKAVRKKGLRADRYIGEITSIKQTITHGGLSAHNFRNKAGLLGAASFLLENRLDLSTGTYPTPRNIKERVRKQMLCISSFLSVCLKNSDRLMELSEKARTACCKNKTIQLQPEYVQNPASPSIEIPLRRISTGKLVTHRFPYRKNISGGPATVSAATYRFHSQPDFFKEWLDKQGIPSAACRTQTKSKCIEAKSNGMNGCLLPLYLEKKSVSSILERLPFDPNDVWIQRE